MSDDNHTHYVSPSLSPQESDRITSVFSQLKPEDVEQFYRAYHYWSEQQRIEMQQSQIQALKQEIAANAERMRQVQPSPIALATLAQLQASGVTDVDLLDRMYERGDDWLDHTMQLLEHCERLDVIRGNYTEWCEHALEGAYDWLASIDPDATNDTLASDTITIDASSSKPLIEVTEELLLQKLMSEEDAEKLMVVSRSSRITGELPPLDETTEETSEAELITSDGSQLAEEILLIEDIPASPEEALITEDVFETADNTFTIEDVPPENSLLIEDTVVPLENAILPEDVITSPDDVLSAETSTEISAPEEEVLPSEPLPALVDDTPENTITVPSEAEDLASTETDQQTQDELPETVAETALSPIQPDDANSTPTDTVLIDDEVAHENSTPASTDATDDEIAHSTAAPLEEDTVQNVEDLSSPVLADNEVEEMPTSTTELDEATMTPETTTENTAITATEPVEVHEEQGAQEELEITQPLRKISTVHDDQALPPPSVTPDDEPQKLDDEVPVPTTPPSSTEHKVDVETLPVQTPQKKPEELPKKRPGFFARLFAKIWGRSL